MSRKSDIAIAREAQKQPIKNVASRLHLSEDHLIPFGHDKAKLSFDCVQQLAGEKRGKLILVTAINPTPAGEGKTTTTVGLVDGLNRIGEKAIVCIREASLGPCFGMKGGAAGGGYAQVIPMEDMNLHFTGDFHAITAAHNLLAALVDNHIHWGNQLNIDPRRVAIRRVLDMNDRSLRKIVSSLGGVANGVPREAGFDITVASEVMAILCLANDLSDLKERLGNMVVGYNKTGHPVYCRDLKADGAMTVLLQQALQPNLVQTLENNPAFVHGGPFANIAHGCNSVIATKTALALADYVVTEAGFGSDLGAEKFFDIKCRKAELKPDGVVLVATVRALKMHGGVQKAELGKENVNAVRKGCENLGRHLENLKKFGVPTIVAVNHFVSDTNDELNSILRFVADQGVEGVVARHWELGSKGSEELAQKVVALTNNQQSVFEPLYKDELSLLDKIEVIAKEIYRASEVEVDQKIIKQLSEWEQLGYGSFPICMAKTQYSFSTSPQLVGAPTGHILQVREVRLSAGAGFVVVVCGDVMTMPGLPRVPAAETIFLSEENVVEGLF